MTKEEFIKKIHPMVNSVVTKAVLSHSGVSCWDCKYCDKESILKDNAWILTRTGYCLAEKSTANGENDFYKKVYVDTVYRECSQYELLN